MQKVADQYYSLFYESTSVMLLIDASTGEIKDANIAACSYYGWSHSELCRKNISEINTLSRQEIQEELKKAEKELRNHFFFRHRLASGEIRDVEVFSSPSRSSDSRTLFSIVHDITQRKQLEEALLNAKKKAEENEGQLRAIFDNSKDAIGISKNGIVVLVNIAYLDMFGYTNQDEIVGKPLLNQISPQEHDKIIQYIKKRNNNQIAPKYYETIGIRKNGTEFPFELNVGTYVQKNEMYTVGIIRDITERKKLEEELLKTQKLEALGLFAGGIAHDFNNLMGGIFGFIDMAKEESNNVMVNHFLTKAIDTIDRARGLTMQLLTYSKGGTPIKKIDTLFPFIKDTVQFALSGSNILCSFDVDDNLWLCSFDKNQIGQVIDNIVINAKQAMPGGGLLEISASNITLTGKEAASLTGKDYVKISIKDHGIGISKENLSRIFDPFYTTKTTGHGLGLTTCYSIVKQHSGYIEVASDPGKGSRFDIFLPASKDYSPSGSENTLTKHQGKGTFLVVDDEEVLRETIGSMLESLGYTVVTKENGTSAIAFIVAERIEKKEIAGMIFDLTIPGDKGGAEIITEIRKLGVDTPAFVTSGYAEDPIMATPEKHGFLASICKPFRKCELSEMLNTYLGPKK